MDKPISVFDMLIKQRDEEREAIKTAKVVLREKELPLENNPMGLYKWYLHPGKRNVGTRTLLVWMQEIPPKSCSGKQKTQGGQIHIVLEGHGYTVIDGVRHDWDKFDAIFLPLLPDGTTHQHFNSDDEKWAKLLCAEPNFIDALGVDKGSGFDVLEKSPDYKPIKNKLRTSGTKK